MRLLVEVVVRRGSIAESRHHLQCALVDLEGNLASGSETPGIVTTFRSAAKPFQLLPLVERGHADRWGFSDEQLAVMASSHTGSRYHLTLVSGILERIGATPELLVCGYHDPDDSESRDELFRGSVPRSALYNNCSGKHAGLLALAISEGWPVEGYHRPEHPVQQLMRNTVAEACGVAPESLGTAIDGCNVVVFAAPLAVMARGFARLASAMARQSGDARTVALGRIGRAMTAYPFAVEGKGRTSTALMVASGGRLVAKGGAEGLQLVGWTERGVGLAVKCEDGAGRAVGPAVVGVLEQLGALSAAELASLEQVRNPVVTNAAGLDVGTIEAVVREASRA